MTWREQLRALEVRGTLEHVRQRLHDAIYFDKPLTDDDLRKLARDVERSLAA